VLWSKTYQAFGVFEHSMTLTVLLGVLPFEVRLAFDSAKAMCTLKMAPSCSMCHRCTVITHMHGICHTFRIFGISSSRLDSRSSATNYE
jgi:hypothetical protein